MSTSKKALTARSTTRKSKNDRANMAKQITASDSGVAMPVGPPKARGKQQKLAALLVRDEGATLDQMIAATGWLSHTTRAALTGLRKAGYAIDSDKNDGVRTYRAVAPK